MMKKFVVIGHPINHSKSPQIHQAFAKQAGISLSYERLLAPIAHFSAVAKDFFAHGGSGANVTVPFKGEALNFADQLSADAKIAGAVNTLWVNDGKIIGDNTDGIGLVTDIRENHQRGLGHQKVLIIGAGGAARGVILPIAREHPYGITISNRTPSKAQTMVDTFSPIVDKTTLLNALPLDELAQPYDVVINATSTSLTGQALPLNPQVFNQQTLAYDMMYSDQPTAFMQLAMAQGATAVDGLGMLVEQAAASFAIWHGIKPQTIPVIAKLRQSTNG